MPSGIHQPKLEPGGEYTVWLDQWATRNKWFHYITDDEGEIVYQTRWAHEIFTALASVEVERVIVHAGDLAYRVTLVPTPST